MYTCRTCAFLEKHGGRPWQKNSDEQCLYQFDKLDEYQAHWERENICTPDSRYLLDEYGKNHLNCFLGGEPTCYHENNCPSLKTLA